MKKFAIISSILLIIVVLVAGCQPAKTPSTTKQPTTGDDTTYSNPAYGFSFKVCNNPEFELIENHKGTTVALAGPLLADFKHEIGIYVIADKLPRNTKLEDYLKATRKEAESTLTNFAITEESTKTIGGIQAKSMSYTYAMNLNDKDYTFRNTLVVFIKDNIVYAIKFDTPDEFYDQFVECFNLLISTFKLK